jgi:hypothetical protein
MRRLGCRWQAVNMIVISGIALSIVVWAVSAVVMDRWVRRRQRRSLLKTLPPYQTRSVADEAQIWLEERQRSQGG